MGEGEWGNHIWRAGDYSTELAPHRNVRMPRQRYESQIQRDKLGMVAGPPATAGASATDGD